VVFGTDLDGKQISQSDRLKAAVDLADSGISVLSGLGAVTGSTATVFEIAAAPPLAIGLVQAKLMLWVMEELGTMMGNIAQGQLRDRFRLGDGDDKQFKQAFAQLERDALKDPMAAGAGGSCGACPPTSSPPPARDARPMHRPLSRGGGGLGEMACRVGRNSGGSVLEAKAQEASHSPQGAFPWKPS
jgi:hypothetical protein